MLYVASGQLKAQPGLLSILQGVLAGLLLQGSEHVSSGTLSRVYSHLVTNIKLQKMEKG